MRSPAATHRYLRFFQAAFVFLPGVLLAPIALADGTIQTIDRIKGSVVAIGTFQRTRVPPFRFIATGFAVGDGSLIATNAHALPEVLDKEHRETLAVLVPSGLRGPQVREARELAVDLGTDLALLKIDGPGLTPLRLRDADTVQEGQEVLFTGFPIGSVIGLFPVTHRGMVSAITPIAIPPASSSGLDQRMLRRLTTGSYPILQLDATAYPGNSGSPVFDPETGEVLGIINMVFVKGTKEAVLTQPSGITYAIPAKYLQSLLTKIN